MRLLRVSQFATLVNAFSSQTKQYQSMYAVAVLLSSLISFQGISNGFFLHSLPHQYIRCMSASPMQIALLPLKLFKTRSSSYSLQMLLVLSTVHTSHVILLVRIAMLPGIARVTSLKTASLHVPSIYALPTC